MGFLSKSYCVLCNDQVSGIIKRKIKDGHICNSCLSLCSPHLDSLTTRSNSDIKDHIAYMECVRKEFEYFSPSLEVSNFMVIDDTAKKWYIPIKNWKPDVFNFNNIIDYELIEDGEVIQKGGISRAVAGGLLFGGAGAVVGGITGRKSKEIISHMYIRISLNNKWVKNVNISLINIETKKNGIIYQSIKPVADKIISYLDYMVKDTQSLQVTNSNSSADEILKYKKLLDDGVISEEEYVLKKKQLLDL